MGRTILILTHSAETALLGRLLVETSSPRPEVVTGDRLPDELTPAEQIERLRPALLVLSRRSASLLTRFAPNLASLLGGDLWIWHADASALSEADKQIRLDRLRAWSGLCDDEVVAQAKQKVLPTEPQFAEWLVLLGRGDLLEG